MSSYFWTKEVTHALIEEYRARTCLWKTKSKDYLNRTIRARAYDELLFFLKSADERLSDLTLTDLKKKIDGLRTTFRREYTKVITSQQSGLPDDYIYKPTLWYYSMMTFLIDGDSGPMVFPSSDGAPSSEQKIQIHHLPLLCTAILAPFLHQYQAILLAQPNFDPEFDLFEDKVLDNIIDVNVGDVFALDHPDIGLDDLVNIAASPTTDTPPPPASPIDTSSDLELDAGLDVLCDITNISTTPPLPPPASPPPSANPLPPTFVLSDTDVEDVINPEILEWMSSCGVPDSEVEDMSNGEMIFVFLYAYLPALGFPAPPLPTPSSPPSENSGVKTIDFFSDDDFIM